ncbi:MAG: proline dehydrogenase [Calditrichaeota bacterium]|nr:MAG: proline dehydrogenase [Calditrichota bacterium]
MQSLNKLISYTLPFIPKSVMRLFARMYIAGEHLSDAVRVVRELMAQGACATIDVLGEEVTNKEQALQAVDAYLEVLQTIHQEKLDASISLKPTHMGLKIDREFCYRNIERLVQEAARYNNFVRIDMEDSSCTDDTIDMYLRLKKDYDNVGTVIQAYLRRTISDVNRLIPEKANLRLCKGIYQEPRDIAYKDRFIIRENYAYCLEKLLSNGCYVGIATHDEHLVWEALRLIDQYGLTPQQYEFQMLLGVDEQLRRIIIREGHRMRVYVPFGEEWRAYSIRRLKENPHIIGQVMRNVRMKLIRREN